jgi:hypothetical protein
MKKVIAAFMASAGMLLSGSNLAHAALGDVIDLEVQGSTFAGHGPVLTNGHDLYQYSISSATGEAGKMLVYYGSDGGMKVTSFSYTTNASTAISNIGGSSAMQSTPYAFLFDGYMTGNPGVTNTISFSFLDANTTYKLVVYSQAEVGTTASLKINDTLVINNTLSGLGALTEATAGNSYLGNYAVVDGLKTNGSGVLSFSYEGQISGLQLQAVPEPASAVLLGVGGLVGALGLRRSREKSVA